MGKARRGAMHSGHRDGLVPGTGNSGRNASASAPSPLDFPPWKARLCRVEADSSPETPHYCGVIGVMPSSHFILVSGWN